LISDFVIGLDVSTSCTGVSAMSLDGVVRYITYHKPNGNSLVEKTKDFQAFLENFLTENSLGTPKAIFVEQNLQKFRRGFSSAQVINKLARYNGMVSYVVYERFGIIPIYVNVNEGRKSLGIKIPRGSDTKELILAWCQNSQPHLSWPTKKLKSGPRKNLVIIDPCCYDMADATITALAGLKLHDVT
jgi:hypothetical protein